MRRLSLAPAFASLLVCFSGCASHVDSDGVVAEEPSASVGAPLAAPDAERAPLREAPLVALPSESTSADDSPRFVPTPPRRVGELPLPALRIAAVIDADSPLPDEWKDIMSLASTAAGAFTGFTSALSTANSVLTTLGFLKGQESAIDGDFHKLDSKMSAIEEQGKAGFHDTWAQLVGVQTGGALAARSSAAQSVVGGAVVHAGDLVDVNTRTAVAVLEQPSFWFRPSDAGIYSGDHMFDIVKDRPSGKDFDGYGSVWDYRTTLPALLQVAQARLDVLSMMDPQFVRNGHYADEMLALQTFLRGVHDHMLSGIRCGWEYTFLPGFDPAPPASAMWRYQAGCIDIYSGASSFRFEQWWNTNEPDADGTWAASAAPADLRNGRADLASKMGMPALEQLIAKLGWYAQIQHPLYTGFEALAHTGVYDSVSVVTPNDSAAAAWSYDPALHLLWNGEGRCLQTSNFVSASVKCDWNDPGFQWVFDSPTRIRNVKTNKCLDTASSGGAVGNVQPCDGRATEAITFLPPQGGACRSAPTPASKRVRSDLAIPWDDGGQTSVAVFASQGNQFPGGTQWMVGQGGWGNTGRWASGDFDGDGMADLAGIWNDSGSNSIAVRSSNGSTLAFKPGATRVGGWSDATQWIPGDFDGDGYDDLASAWNDGGRVSLAFFRSLGRSGGFAYPVAWSKQDGGWGDDVRWVSGYFYGNDRRADLVAIWNDGGMNTLSVRQSTGSSFVYVPSASGTRWGSWLPNSQWLPGDFDGDGNTDVAVAWNDGGSASIAVVKGGITGFTGYAQVAPRNSVWSDFVKWTSGDYNADGKTDLAAVFEDQGQNSIVVRTSTGTSFTAGPIVPRQGGWQDSSQWCSGHFVR